MSYFSLYYHFTWHTNGSMSILIGDKKNQVWEIIRFVIMKSPQMFYVAIGGTADHVHVIVYSMSTITFAKIAQLLKGASSEIIDKKMVFPFRFSWHHEYGCVTDDKRDLQRLKPYVSQQEEHH